MTLEQLCLVSVPEADIAELAREFDRLVYKIDAVRRSAGDEDRHRRFRELRVTVTELEGSVDQLVALLTQCAGRLVSRGELIAEFRATQMSHKLAELDNQVRTATTTDDPVVGGSAIQAVNAVSGRRPLGPRRSTAPCGQAPALLRLRPRTWEQTISTILENC